MPMKFLKHLKTGGCWLAGIAMLLPGSINAVNCTYGTNSGEYPLRALTSFTLTDGNNNSQIYNVNQKAGRSQEVYIDLRNDTPLVTSAGSELSFSAINWGNNEWMHGYLFIDYNEDTDYDEEDGELVSFSYYDGKNSKGLTASNNHGVGGLKDAMPSFIIPAELQPGKYNCLFKIDWNNKTQCGDQVAKSGGCAVEFSIEVAGVEEREITIESNDLSKGSVSFKDHPGLSSLTIAGPVTVVATPVKGFSFYNWTNGGQVVSDATEYTITGNDPMNLVGVFGDLKYPTMKRTFTNDATQSNRYLKRVTTEGTQTPEVFNCSVQGDLPYTAYTTGSGYVETGANIEKFDNPIVIESGIPSFKMTYYAWTTAIGTYTAQLNWTQEALFIDWNGDGRFEGDDEIYGKGVTAMGTSNPITTTTGLSRTVTIPDGQPSGTYRMRVVFFEPSNSDEEWQKTLFTALGGQIRNGISYDMLLTISEPREMEFVSAAASSYSGTVKTGAQNVPIASFNIVASGTLEPLTLNKVVASYSGSDPSDISNLRWVYSKTSDLGNSSVASLEEADESMTFNFNNYQLTDGNNYFVLVADVNENATPEDIINVAIDQIYVDDDTIQFTPASTQGGLSVVYEIDYTLGNAIWFDSANPYTYTEVWKSYSTWYNSYDSNPDQNWERKSFPIGNGSFGGNVMGSIATERVVLNEKSLWRGGPNTGVSTYWNMNKTTITENILQQIRTYLEQGNNAAADALVKQHYAGNIAYNKDVFGSFATMGEAYISTGLSTSVSDYKRILNMDKGLVVVQFNQGNTSYVRKYFASYPDNVQVWNFSSDGNTQNLTFSFACAHNSPTIEKKDDGLLYKSSVANNGMQWAMRVYVRINGPGTMTVNASNITITGANNVDFILAADTDYKMNFDPDFSDPKTYVGEDPVSNVNEWIEKAKEYTYEQLYNRHFEDYNKLYGRTDIKINPNQIFTNQPTPTRLQSYKGGTLDHGLEQQYFQYGRYLLISSSREGSMPANLQGMWHNHIDGPWRVDYHNNINLQMNYWPATSTNLLECFTPLVDYVRGLVKPGEKTAQAYYKARGWTAEVSTNIFGFTAPLNSDQMSWNYNPTAGPWLATQLWEYYDYTRNKEWLDTIGYDIIKGAANFCSDLLYFAKGSWTSAPSYSPEHGTADLGATYANAVTREILKDAIQAATILEKDEELVEEWKGKLDNIYPYQVGQHGQLQEWYEDIDSPTDDHRHTNHLFGLHPGSTINAVEDDTLREACKMTLTQRGDAATGWSMGWKLNHWARLLDGNHAYILFQNLLKQGTADNMWDLHPPFQIDGNFGGTAGIAELFLQSHNGFLHLLPALPGAWTNGQITGLLARGNFEVDIYYDNNELDHAMIRSNMGEPCSVYYKGKTLDFETVAGGEYMIDLDDEDNLQMTDMSATPAITIGSVDIVTNPDENPIEAAIYAKNVVVKNADEATINVAYKLNNEPYVSMDYVDAEDHYTSTIPYVSLEKGEYRVTVKAEALVGGDVVASDEKDGGSFVVDENSTTSITDLDADKTAGVTFYTPQGVKVANPSNGIYIRVEGNKVSKVFIK